MRAPGTRLTVRAPDGRRWRVGRQWLPGDVTTIQVLRRNRQRTRDEISDPADYGKRRGESDGGGSDVATDDTGGGFDLMDGDSLAIGLVLIVVLGLLFFLVFPLLEAVIVVALLAAGVASRVVLRRPWRVEARLLDGDPPRAHAHWDVVGFRRSGRRIEEVAEHITATGRLPQRTTDTLPSTHPSFAARRAGSRKRPTRWVPAYAGLWDAPGRSGTVLGGVDWRATGARVAALADGAR